MGPFLVILEVYQRPLNVRGLPSLVTPAEKQHAFPAGHRLVDAVARSPIHPKFAQSLAQGLAVAKIPAGEPVDPAGNLRLGAGVGQLRQPVVEDIFSGACDVMANLNHDYIVTYKLQLGKASRVAAPFA